MGKEIRICCQNIDGSLQVLKSSCLFVCWTGHLLMANGIFPVVCLSDTSCDLRDHTLMTSTKNRDF